MMTFSFLKQYFKYLVITAVSLVAIIFFLPLLTSIAALAIGHDSNIAYLISVFFIVLIVKKFYPLALITPIILILIEKLWPAQKEKAPILSGVITITLFLVTWGTAFTFDYTKSIFNEGWKSRIQYAQHLDKTIQSKTSEDLCRYIDSALDIEGQGIQATLKNIDTVSRNAGFKLATENAYISRGYITYYFKPIDHESLQIKKEKTAQAFQKKNIGPTMYWLNINWYKKQLQNQPYDKNDPLIDINGQFIQIRFETTFPLLKDFVEDGILQTPPSHILKTAQEVGLMFVKSERRDFISYEYSVPVFFLDLLGGHFNLGYTISGSRTKNGYEDMQVEKITCLWPSHNYDARQGQPASKKIHYPPSPVEIPSCSEYSTWLRCQMNIHSHVCDAPEFRKGTPEPVCKRPQLWFPKDTYGSTAK